MKSLQRATEEYERAKAKAEMLQEKTQEAVRKMRECEAAKIEAENMEYARVVREMNLTIPELLQLKKLREQEPTMALVAKEDEKNHEEISE